MKLGRVSKEVLLHVPNIEFFYANLRCPVCPTVKQHKRPFNNSSISSTYRLELLHCDVWGPYRQASKSGAYYFLTIVDDYSRMTWVVLLQNKTQIHGALTVFLKMAQTQFNAKTKLIRSDNGLEFVNSRNRELFQKFWIIHQRSCPYTPQQNGVAERKHRQLLNIARALLFQAKMEKSYWGEVILLASAICNVLLPSRLLGWASPHEKFYGTPANYEKFHVFGSFCYYIDDHPSKDKFSPRAKPAVFIGFSEQQKGYKLLDLQHHSFVDSRNVSFYDTIFPFCDHKTQVTQQETIPAICNTEARRQQAQRV